MKALLSVQGNQGKSSDKLESLLGKFDTDGDGKISQSEFETAIGPDADVAKVDELFKKLDGNGDDAVGQDELKAAVQKAHGHHHRHEGTTSQSATNADGSSTATITYADGTKVAMTTPA